MQSANKYFTKQMSIKEIRECANLIRKLAGCEMKLHIDIIKLLDIYLPLIYNDFYAVPLPANEMPNNYAETDLIEGCIRIRDDVYLNASNGKARDRFTVAHEIGHYVMQRDSIFVARAEVIVPYDFNPEWQANQFAAELLMPYNLVKDMGINEMAHKCKVSYQAAAIRYKDIHYYGN